MSDHHELIDFYRSYGEATFAIDQPAYAQVCRELGSYPGIVALLAAHDPQARQPNLLFAAVHYLLLGGMDHPLRDAYRKGDADVVAHFAELVLSHQDEINHLLATQRTQTNEVGRSALLALMLRHAHQITGQQLAWIDLGASGGLNLNLDRFRIDYAIDGRGRSTGHASPVTLNCEVRSGTPPIDADHAPIRWRVGVDRSPIDVTDVDQARWLQACLWPTQTERHDRLDAAISIARDNPPAMITADAVEGLRRAIVLAPTDAALVVTTTWVWYYLPDATKREVFGLLRESGRRVLWYSLEGRGIVAELNEPLEREAIESTLGLVDIDGGAVHARVLGIAHAHGTWLDWRADP